MTARTRSGTPRALLPAGIQRAAIGCALLLSAGAAEPALADWPTARGNAQRTGCVDGRRGPRKPKVLWAHRAQEHFIGSPVPLIDRLFVPGLGTFNTGTFHCFSLATETDDRLLWSKVAPFLKRPTVCSPAVQDGLVIVGDGMHQTDDAILYCLRAAGGRMVWQYPVPGKLVHMEGSPLVHRDRVYIGAGDAGVICVRLDRLVLEGKEYDLDAAQELLDTRWKELAAQYEREKKKDPDFAVPPTDDDLPKPAPKLEWQAGKGQWHVDAPLAAGRRILVASAYLEQEKCGKRALIALRTDGQTAWEVPLKHNPWAGATVAGSSTVLVACSSIRYETRRLGEAAGEIVALSTSSSQAKVRWRKDVPGGVLSPIACADGLAVFTATDGVVRAWDVATGAEKWACDCGAPFFAGAAIARGAVYVADLKGSVHAIDLALGRKLWSLKLQADPLVRTPGAIYGSPIVHNGRIYVGTCNVEGPHADQPGAVVCIADAETLARDRAAVKVAVDPARRTVSVPCRVAPRKLPHLKETYPVEVIATRPHPGGQKAHETVVTLLASPRDVHEAMEKLGLAPGKPAKGLEGKPEGPEVRIALAFPTPEGGERRLPIEQALIDRRTGRTMPPVRWHFTGSAMKQPDPEKPVVVYGADFTGTLISVFPITEFTVFQSDLGMEAEGLLRLDTNRAVLPAEHTPGRLIIEAVASRPAGAHRPVPTSADRFAPDLPPLPPRLASPAPAESVLVVPMTADADPPRPAVHDAPRRLAIDALRPLSAPPPADVPPPAVCTRPLTDRPLPLRVGPLARARTPDIDRLPDVRMYPHSPPRRPDPADDPTRPAARRVLLSHRPTGRSRPAPYHRLVLPDPFEHLHAVRLRTHPPDDAPPERSWQLPPPPKMP